MRRVFLGFIYLLLASSILETAAQVLIDTAPYGSVARTFVSNNTRYGPGICGLTVTCSPFVYRWAQGPVASTDSPCYNNVSETDYRTSHTIPAAHSLSNADFTGFACGKGGQCALAPRVLSDAQVCPLCRWETTLYVDTTCVCTDPCWTGPTCSTPRLQLDSAVPNNTNSNATYYTERRGGFEACVNVLLDALDDQVNAANASQILVFEDPTSDPLGSLDYESIYVLDLHSNTNVRRYENASINVTLLQCQQTWKLPYLVGGPSIPAPSTWFDGCPSTPAPCSLFPGGGCPTGEICQRRLVPGMDPSLEVRTLVRINNTDVWMNMVPQDVCCLRGWIGSNCDQPSGCLASGCQHNGTCISTTRNAKTGVSVQLPGQDIRCINCDPGWTGLYCDIPAPMYASSQANVSVAANNDTTVARRRLLQVSDPCNVVFVNTGFRSNAGGAIYPEPGRACDCGVQWLSPVVLNSSSSSNSSKTWFRVLTLGNYAPDFTQLHNVLLSPIRYPINTLFGFNPQQSRSIGSIAEAQFVCGQDWFCNGIYLDATGTQAALVNTNYTNSSVLPFVPASFIGLNRLSPPRAYPRAACTNDTLDPAWYCSQYPVQCNSVRIQGGVGNMVASNLTTAQVAELHWRVFGHQVHNAPNPSCDLSVDWFEDQNTCTQSLRCAPVLTPSASNLFGQVCSNLTYMQTLEQGTPNLLQRIDTYPAPFIASVGSANTNAEHGGNGTCLCVPPFVPSNNATQADCAEDLCGVISGQGKVNASSVIAGVTGMFACDCITPWLTDPATCVNGYCNWCQKNPCSNFGTETIDGACLCTPYFTGALCDQSLCNASTTNITLMTTLSAPVVSCAPYCVTPWEGPYCNLTSCVHGVRLYNDAYECRCPPEYKVEADGTCPNLRCGAGHGVYNIFTQLCECVWPWTGNDCSIDLCQAGVGGAASGQAVQNVGDDGLWYCACNWPWTNRFAQIGPNNTWGDCSAPLCGDWGFPVSNWNASRPQDACNCQINFMGLPYNQYAMGIYTDVTYCTAPSAQGCPAPCSSANCGLSNYVNLTVFATKVLVAEVSKAPDGSGPICICPAEYNQAILGDAGHTCRPFIPCTINNRSIPFTDVNGNTGCTCVGTVASGYYTSNVNSNDCGIYHPPSVNNTNPTFDGSQATPKGVTNSPNTLIPNMSDAAAYTIIAAGLAFATVATIGAAGALSGATAGVATGSTAAVAESSAQVAAPVINVTIIQPAAGSTAASSVTTTTIPAAATGTMGRRLSPFSFKGLGNRFRRGYTAMNILISIGVFSMISASCVHGHNSVGQGELNVGNFKPFFGYLAMDIKWWTGRTYNGGPDLCSFGAQTHWSPGQPYFDINVVVYPSDSQWTGPYLLPGTTWTIRNYNLSGATAVIPQFIGNQLITANTALIATGGPVPGTSINIKGYYWYFNLLMYPNTDSVCYINLCPPSGSLSCGPNGKCVILVDFQLNSPLQGSPPPLACSCDVGYGGQYCDKPCVNGMKEVCSGKGKCSPLSFKNGDLKAVEDVHGTSTNFSFASCLCNGPCVCDDGAWMGDNCDTARPTVNHIFTQKGVRDYSVCCPTGSWDCGPIYNMRLGQAASQCIPAHVGGDGTTSSCTLSAVDSTGNPSYNEHADAVDNCNPTHHVGVCWQGMRNAGPTADSTKSMCFCNPPVGWSSEVVGTVWRGSCGTTCQIITCTQKTAEWPEGNVFTITLANTIAARCSGRAYFSVQNDPSLHSDPTSAADLMCLDAVRVGFQDAATNTASPSYTNSRNDSWLNYWRVNTFGDCVKCQPGYGLYPVDFRQLQHTAFRMRNVISDDTEIENWNGVCSVQTFHDELGNPCGGYGVPVYGISQYFAYNDSIGHKQVRTVVGCLCPENTVTLQSGICQRTVANAVSDVCDSDGNCNWFPANKSSCGAYGIAYSAFGINEICACWPGTHDAWNGPYCNQYDTRLYGRLTPGKDQACLNGQYSYYNGVPVNNLGSNQTPDHNYVAAVSGLLGANINPATGVSIDRRAIPNTGYFDPVTTALVNTVWYPNAAFASATPGNILSMLSGMTGGYPYPFPGVGRGGAMIAIVTLNQQTVWGEWDDNSYLRLNPDLLLGVSSTGWDHFRDSGYRENRQIAVFTDQMPDPSPGVINFGRFNASCTTSVNTKIYFRHNFISTDPWTVLNGLTMADGTAPQVVFCVDVYPTYSTQAWGVFQWIDYLAFYPSAVPNGNAAGAWAHYQAHHTTFLAAVRIPQELQMMNDEINSMGYSQFSCSCSQSSISQGRSTVNNLCMIACNSTTLTFNNQTCSGNGTCSPDPLTNDYGCICNTTLGRGGSACETSALISNGGQVCGGSTRGTIVVPSLFGQHQACTCKSPYHANNCTNTSSLYCGSCIYGDPLCSQSEAHYCSSSSTGSSALGIQGVCAQNSVTGDWGCTCRPGAFTGPACDVPTTPALQTASGTLLSCTGRGIPDPKGGGYCICDPGFVGYACEIAISNRQCTFNDGTIGLPYQDNESNQLLIRT